MRRGTVITLFCGFCLLATGCTATERTSTDSPGIAKPEERAATAGEPGQAPRASCRPNPRLATYVAGAAERNQVVFHEGGKNMRTINSLIIALPSTLVLMVGFGSAEPLNHIPMTSIDAAQQSCEAQMPLVVAAGEGQKPPSGDVEERGIRPIRPGEMSSPPHTVAPPSPFYGCSKGTCTCTNQEDCLKMLKLDVCASQLTGNSDGTFSCKEKQN